MRIAEPKEYTVQQQKERGRQAAALLDDDVLRDAFGDAEQTFLRAWLEGKTVEARETAWAKIHALSEVQRALHRIMADGEHAEMKLRSAQ